MVFHQETSAISERSKIVKVFIISLYQYSRSLQEFATDWYARVGKKVNQWKNVNFYWKSFLFYDKIEE